MFDSRTEPMRGISYISILVLGKSKRIGGERDISVGSIIDYTVVTPCLICGTNDFRFFCVKGLINKEQLLIPACG